MHDVKHILLVDDDDTAIFISKMKLKRLKFEGIISIALDGQEAIDLFDGWEVSQFPELILLDINMPVMDGFQFLENLLLKQYHEHSKVIILSSSFLLKDRQRSAAYRNVIGYYEKPINLDKLSEVIENLDDSKRDWI